MQTGDQASVLRVLSDDYIMVVMPYKKNIYQYTKDNQSSGQKARVLEQMVVSRTSFLECS